MVVRSGPLMYDVSDRKMRPETCGETNFKRGTAQIDNTMPEPFRRETLLHEMVHIEFPWLPEETVCMISHGMFRMLCENPEAVDYIRGAD